MAKIDDVLTEIRLLNTKLYGDAQFEGDIPEIKGHLKNLNSHLEDHSKRITITETLQKERHKPSKKIIGGYISGAIAVVVALWKAFTSG